MPGLNLYKLALQNVLRYLTCQVTIHKLRSRFFTFMQISSLFPKDYTAEKKQKDFFF